MTVLGRMAPAPGSGVVVLEFASPPRRVVWREERATGPTAATAELEAAARASLAAFAATEGAARRNGLRDAESLALRFVAEASLDFDSPDASDAERRWRAEWLAARLDAEHDDLIARRDGALEPRPDAVDPPMGRVRVDSDGAEARWTTPFGERRAPVRLAVLDTPLEAEDLELARRLGFNALGPRAGEAPLAEAHRLNFAVLDHHAMARLDHFEPADFDGRVVSASPAGFALATDDHGGLLLRPWRLERAARLALAVRRGTEPAAVGTEPPPAAGAPLLLDAAPPLPPEARLGPVDDRE